MISTGSDFFSKSSFGNLDVELDFNNKWYRMSKPSSGYNMRRGTATALIHYNYLSEALSIADEDYDFSQTDTFIVITNPDAKNIEFGPAFIGTSSTNFKADGKTFYTSTNSGYDLNVWGGLWLNHEVLHNMGLPDLYRYGGNPTWHGLVGQFSIMGLISGAAPDLFGYEKWMLGWLDEGGIFCTPQGESIVDIVPVESSADGKKIIILPLSRTRSIVVESRRSIELDWNIPQEGVLVYLVDSSIPNGQGVLKILPELPYNETKFDLLLKEGDFIEYDGYKIEILVSTDSYDRIKINKN